MTVVFYYYITLYYIIYLYYITLLLYYRREAKEGFYQVMSVSRHFLYWAPETADMQFYINHLSLTWLLMMRLVLKFCCKNVLHNRRNESRTYDNSTLLKYKSLSFLRGKYLLCCWMSGKHYLFQFHSMDCGLHTALSLLKHNLLW